MNYYLSLALVLFLYMNFWFIISVIKKRNDVADLGWGIGFVLLAWTSLLLAGSVQYIAVITNILVTVWGLRLASHILNRIKAKPEDSRYAAWRREWKFFYIRSYLQVFMLQGLFLFAISLPVLHINRYVSSGFRLFELVGIAVWLVGFYFEAIADKQLKAFISNPNNKGKIMTNGLWKYSRHPNYFGEVTQWWGIFIIGLFVPGSFYTILGPLTITILILFVSGVPLLENKYSGRADFEAYKRKTSIFIPMPPRNA